MFLLSRCKNHDVYVYNVVLNAVKFGPRTNQIEFISRYNLGANVFAY